MKSMLVLALAGIVGCGAPKRGVLIMAHGGEAAWDETVVATVAPIREKYPVEIAFGMARPSTIEEAVHSLERQGVERIAIVRMFVSGESFLEQTEYIVGKRDDMPPPIHVPEPGGAADEAHAQELAMHAHCFEPLRQISTKATLSLSRQGIADSPLVDEILVDRVRALSTDPARESVLLLAHGPADDAENERWLAKMRQRAQMIDNAGPFRHVQCETLREDWPDRRMQAEQRIRDYVESGRGNDGRVIVIPFRVAGFGPYREVLDGLDYVTDGQGLCPHPNMTRWIEQTAEACFAVR